MKFSVSIPSFLRNKKKKADMRRKLEQDYDYWKKLFEEAKLKKLVRNIGRTPTSVEIFVQKYFPGGDSKMEDEDDFTSIIPDLMTCIEDRENFEDTISWQWVDVTGDSVPEPGDTSSSTLSSNSSEITETIFLKNNFHSSTMITSTEFHR